MAFGSALWTSFTPPVHFLRRASPMTSPGGTGAACGRAMSSGMTGSTSVRATKSKAVDGLLSGLAWDGPITFGFPDSPFGYGSAYGSGEPATGFAPVPAAMRDAVRAALLGTPDGRGKAALSGMGVAQFTVLDIAAGDAGADIRIAESRRPPTAWAYMPGTGIGGDVWFGTAYAGTSFDYRNPVLGNYAYLTVLHELGHALGLKHAHEAGGVAGTALPKAQDSLEFTVMTYRSYVGGAASGYTIEQWGAPQGYMMLDIAALQAMYGADFATRGGDDIYRWDPATGQMSIDGIGQGTPGGNRVFLTLWDGGGHDTYELSNYAGGVTVDLTPGGFSVLAAGQLAKLGTGHMARGNVFNALQYHGDARSLIEDAIGGAGNDTLRGNAAANLLQGGAGNDSLAGLDGIDTLDGGSGADSLAGGGGDDTYLVSSSADQLTEAANQGSDTVITGLAWILGANLEALILTGTADIAGTGNALANRIEGNAGANRLVGAAGNDSLLGGAGNDTLDGGAGSNSLTGGAGDDTYLVASPSDTIREEAGAGTDRVVTALAFTLPDQVELLELTGAAAVAVTGNALANLLLGNAGANRLSGLGGDDSLSGGGGNDTLEGGLGADTLLGGAGADLLTGGDGADIFRFLIPGAGGDFLADFNGAADQLEFSAAGFGTGLQAGMDLLAAGRLSLNDTGKAIGSLAQFVYATASHVLWWDTNGAAVGGTTQLAVLRDGTGVTAADFIVIA